MWLLPTRARPEQLIRALGQMESTGISTPGIVLVNPEDYAHHVLQYEMIKRKHLPQDWVLTVVKGDTLGATIEEAVRVHRLLHRVNWIGMISDDAMPITPRWDQKLVECLQGRIHLVSANDNWKAPHRVGACMIYSSEVIRTLGWLFPPGFVHMYQDDVWENLGRATGIWHQAMDVVVEHWHYTNLNLGVFDETYERANTEAKWKDYVSVWERWVREDLLNCVAQVKEMLDGK